MNRSIEWLNANAYRNYPFVEDSVLVAGDLSIPPSTVLDFSLVSHGAYAAQGLILLSVTITDTPVPACTFVFQLTSDDDVTLGFSVPVSASFPYTATCTSNGLQAACVFGEGVIELAANTPGVYTFTTFTPPAVEPVLLVFQDKHRLNSVAAISVGSQIISGYLAVAEGYNCQVVADKETNTLRLSAYPGAGLGRYCGDYDTGEPTCQDVFLSINGMHADDTGNFELIGGNGVSIIAEKDSNVVRVVGSAAIKGKVQCGC